MSFSCEVFLTDPESPLKIKKFKKKKTIYEGKIKSFQILDEM